MWFLCCIIVDGKGCYKRFGGIMGEFISLKEILLMLIKCIFLIMIVIVVVIVVGGFISFFVFIFIYENLI